MDPATVLGVAAAIAQFVELGLKTLVLCKQIRDSDTDTTLLHAELQQSTKQLATIQAGVTLDSFPRDTSRSIKQCSQECSSTARELQDLLSEIRAVAQKKRFGAARAAFRAMKDQKKIEKIQNKLEKCQARFQTAVSVDTREQVLTLLQAQGKMTHTLKDVINPELKRMHDLTHAQISTFQKSSAAAHDTTHEALSSLSVMSQVSRKAISDVDTKVQGRLDHIQMTHTQRAFLRSLEHPDMFARHRQIDAPAPGTFEWIFTRGSSRNDQESRNLKLQGRISKWLRGPQPVFWINGKAGSGKSSLMSFIESHARTRDLLRIWASGRRLYVFSFFFWRAGSNIQNSIAGLLQSLLYQLARDKPAIIASLMSSETSAPGKIWTQARLQRAIEVALSRFSEDRVFILIDGLDEFEGNYPALTTLILRLQSGLQSKFCLSSRPETALTRQLGSFPSLRLQDLNYCDIQNFVHEELGLCKDAFADPQHFHETVHEVVDRAEGIFLWAVLVCKSLISGYESKDDANMLQSRLERTPSGLEALFASMFANIDREHREYLARCFFLLKWSKENSLDSTPNVPLPVLTALLSASPHRSLSDFFDDCRVVEHRTIAQARGLLEKCQPEWSMFDSHDIDPSSFGLDVLRDALSGDVGYRTVSHETYAAETFKMSCIGWVHRSAYDYILGDHGEFARSWRISLDEKRLLRDLLGAQSWLAHYFPGQHMDIYNAPVGRIANVIEDCPGEIKMAGFQALDNLHDTIEIFYYGGGCINRRKSSVVGSKDFRIFHEAKPLQAFWITLIHRSQADYLFTRFARIRSSSYADILCSALINHFWIRYGHEDSNVKSLLPAMTMCLDHLFNKGPLGHSIIASHIFDIGDLKIAPSSWRGRGTFTECVVVSSVSSALVHVRRSYPRPNHDARRHPDTGCFLGASDFAQKLIELSDLWQICYGRGLCGHRENLCIHSPLRVMDWSDSEHADSPGTYLSGSASPAWRLVCFEHTKDRVHQCSSGEPTPNLACFDIKAPRSKQLMNQFEHGQGNHPLDRRILRGTSAEKELCLETIFQEVWADADGQFNDGWQQLYILACLRKYFGTLWNVPEDQESEPDGDCKYEL